MNALQFARIMRTFICRLIDRLHLVGQRFCIREQAQSLFLLRVLLFLSRKQR